MAENPYTRYPYNASADGVVYTEEDVANARAPQVPVEAPMLRDTTYGASDLGAPYTMERRFGKEPDAPTPDYDAADLGVPYTMEHRPGKKPDAPTPDYDAADLGVPYTMEHRPGKKPDVDGSVPAKNVQSVGAGFDLSSIKPVWSSIGGVRTVNLGAGLDLDFENNDYTFRQTRDGDGNIVSTVVEAPENARELGMSLIKKYDPETGSATYSKPEIPEASVAQSLYKSPQFMAPVTASVVNGLFQMLISERMAKAQRDEQRRMLDAQFQVLEKKEEADTERRRRVASIYASLREKRRKGEG